MISQHDLQVIYEWQKRNPEKVKIYSKIYRDRVKNDPIRYARKQERDRIAIRKWRSNRNPEAKRRDRSNHGKEWLKNKIYIRDGEKCNLCGIKENLTLQHRIPKCIGGTYKLENLEILCLKCNMTHYHNLVKKALKYYFDNQ